MNIESLKLLNWEIFCETNLQNEISDISLNCLEDLLSHRSYLVDDILSDADKNVFHSLSSNQQFLSKLSANQISAHIVRYYRHLESLEDVKQFVVKKPIKKEIVAKETIKKPLKSESNAKFEDGGKFIGLKEAEHEKVVVRFPPEASGFLHIGHAKAALINQHYKDYYRGKLILRFDDTNPAKECSEFEHAILDDVKKLGITFDQLNYTSDHFDTLLKYCEGIIKAGHAYVDNTEPETMKKEREMCQESRCRSQSVEENMGLWGEMLRGSEVGVKCCVRIKLDMASKNGCMRDPTIYRCKAESHVRTGDKYKVYPTYDFACPIVDSLEGVTHSLRTSEYNDRNEQFNAILDLVSLRRPHIADYSRLSLQNTVLSKRKLTWIVENGYVDGWDDPRMPTVRGILRHGLTVEGLKEFVIVQGFGRANVVMEWDKIWAFNKKIIDPIAPRFTGLSGSLSDLVIVNVKGQESISHSKVARHPKNSEVGTKDVWYSPRVLVERSDVEDFVVGTNVTFINWGNLNIVKIERDDSGRATSVEASLNLDDRDFKKTLKVTWLPIGDDIGTYSVPMSLVTYGDLITKSVLEKDDDFKSFINKESKKEECMLGDLELRTLKKGDIVQLQRKGYFICDEEYQEKSPLTGREYPLVLINIPEGNKKERVTTGLKVKKNTGVEDGAGSGDRKSGKKEENGVKTKENDDKKKNKENEVQHKKNKENEVQHKKNKENEVQHKEKKENEVQQKKEKKPKEKKIKEEKVTESVIVKGVTRLGLEVKKEENIADWYTQVITKSEMLDYYDISGCYILRPSSYEIWERIQAHFDRAIKLRGVKNCYFPMFISSECLMKEKEHIADFSPEVAWVTKCGDKTMEKPVAIRPTSETAMYPYFGKWIQSHRDLPLKLNQWCNVVRWEFKDPVPFLRSREFLWQEGHTAFATREEAVEEVHDILGLYADVYEQLLAIPVVKGRKTEKEKFAGADFTTTTEIYIKAAGRAIQGATSHHLGQNFSKMFDVTYESREGRLEYVHQNSWGLTTRTIGILVMVHGDNKGLVLPPRVADVQVVIVPCGVIGEALETKCKEVEKRLMASGCRVKADLDEHRKPGWKFNHWELKGVPMRIEIGPRDVAEGTVVLCYRYNGEKETVADNSQLEETVARKLEEIQLAMFHRAKVDLDEHRTVSYTMAELCRGLDNKMMITAPFCGEKTCEEEIKELSARDSVVEKGAPSMGAKSLCIPFEQPENLGHKCVNDSCSNVPKFFTMFGRSY